MNVVLQNGNKTASVLFLAQPSLPDSDNVKEFWESKTCCGEETRSLWTDDGFFKNICMRCGQTFVDTTNVRYRGTPWIGVDLDGTLASDVNSWGDGIIGHPIPAMVARVKKWIAEGVTVKVFTARASSSKQVLAIKKWLAKHGLPDMEVTNVKDRLMIELWDDRCVQVSYNTGQPVNIKKPGAIKISKGNRSGLGRFVKPANLLSRFKLLFTL
jgi:hypothetical protein